MEYQAVIIGAVFVIGVIIVSVISHIRTKKIKEAALTASYGAPPDNKECEFGSIAVYSNYERAYTQTDFRVDNITWNDLEMDSIFARVNACLTSIGEEYLYHCLRKPQMEIHHLLERERTITFFTDHAQERLTAQTYLAALGKTNYNGLATLIFNPNTKMFKYPGIYNILSLLPILCAFTLTLDISRGIICVFLSFALNLIVHFVTKVKVNVEIPTVGYFTNMLYCCKKLCTVKGMNKLSAVTNMKKHYGIFKSLERGFIGTGSKLTNELDFLFEYINILFLCDIRRYNRVLSKIIRYSGEFHDLYRAFGEIDLALCVSSFRKSLQVSTLPEFHDQNAIEFEDIYHPLISSPVTNTENIKNDSLITGSNASGKSTFIKALAINGILAQTIYTCAAARFKTRLSLTVTSMALRDNVLGGDSYFVVEVKSLKRILDLVQQYPCVCFIDEILRGTNTAERIAASASVLEYLHSRDSLCVAASHDIELTSILAGKYDNYHFSEQISDVEILFDYKLKRGASTTRNAIKLLGFMDFPPEIVEMAGNLTDDYEGSISLPCLAAKTFAVL